jgi:hypothetical protein
MSRLASRILLCVCLALPVSSRAASDVAAACGAPDEFITSDEALAQVSAAVSAGGPVDILAIGSATTVGAVTAAGTNTSATQGAFPWRMMEALQTAMPKVQFHLTVRGGRGLTAEEMLPLLDTALKQQHYQLVLWQTGTVEAVRALRPDGLLEVLHTGVDLVRGQGGDLVLIDPQFSRFLRANTDVDAYLGVMQQVATMPGVSLFRRFDLMRAWANDGDIDLERAPKEERDKALDQLNGCLGQALARFVLSGVDTLKK